MRVDDRAHAELAAGHLRDLPDVFDHARPLCIGQPRCALRVACRVITLRVPQSITTRYGAG